MAHKKGVGSTDNGRDSNAKYLGVKLFGGQIAKAGNIIIRQRGTKYHVGENVYLGRDFTIHAKVNGTVTFNKRRNNRTYVSIIPGDAANNNGGVATAPKKAAKKAPKAKSVIENVAESVGAAVGTVSATAQSIVSNVPESTKKSGKTEKIALPSGKKFKIDDLKIVEGIGPKIEQLLHEGGIMTWKNLADAKLETLQSILDEAGPRYRVHNPSTWSQQAQLCVEQKWEALDKLQDELDGGVARS